MQLGHLPARVDRRELDHGAVDVDITPVRRLPEQQLQPRVREGSGHRLLQTGQARLVSERGDHMLERRHREHATARDPERDRQRHRGDDRRRGDGCGGQERRVLIDRPDAQEEGVAHRRQHRPGQQRRKAPALQRRRPRRPDGHEDRGAGERERRDDRQRCRQRHDGAVADRDDVQRVGRAFTAAAAHERASHRLDVGQRQVRRHQHRHRDAGDHEQADRAPLLDVAARIGEHRVDAQQDRQ